ncbi:MAG: hypothetical protein RIT45_426, partial [Pseudomonadota bacterium]
MRTLATVVLTAIVLAALWTRVVHAADAAAPEPDRLGIAALLLRDGHAERADAVLHETTAAQSGDAARWHLLVAVAAIKREQFEAAAAALDAARDAHREQARAAAESHGKTPASRADAGLVELLRAQVAARLERWAVCLDALDALRAAPGAGPEDHARAGLRARALAALGRSGQAYGVLLDAERRLGPDDALLRQRLALLGSLGLYQQMRKEGAGLLARSHEPADHLRMAEALRQGGALREASELIEAARLRFGASAEVVALLALTWVDRGHPRVAARLLEQRAGEEPERWLDAAELYRRAGDLGAALRANSAVLDQPAKVRQRVG